MKYLFIDTNIYRNFFEKESFSEDLFNLLKKQTENENLKILLPFQVIDEVYRNRNEEWYLKKKEQIKNQIISLEKKAKTLELEFNGYKHISKIRKQVEDLIKKKKKELKYVKKQFLNTSSGSNVKLNKVFKIATKIIEDDDILKNAFYRREKNNPPQDGNKLGDKIIWESLLSFFKDVPKTHKPELIFLAYDKSAWRSRVSDDLEFNLWLQKEFKDRTCGSVLYIEKLSDIPDLSIEEKSKVEKEEISEEFILSSDLVYENDIIKSSRISSDGFDEEILTNEDLKN